MQPPSDEHLIRRVADGDIACLGRLFERHHRGLYQYCLQLTRNAAASEDLVQEVFVKVLHGAAGFRGDGSCKAWVFNIARNIAFDYLRRAERQTPMDSSLQEQLVDERSAEKIAASEQNLKLLQAALAQLPAATREVIWLGRFVFEDYGELARALDCTVGAARVRMHRAMRELNSAFLQLNGAVNDVPAK
jgi:RNA polymerase sigma factor (sigma-70 family)